MYQQCKTATAASLCLYRSSQPRTNIRRQMINWGTHFCFIKFVSLPRVLFLDRDHPLRMIYLSFIFVVFTVYPGLACPSRITHSKNKLTFLFFLIANTCYTRFDFEFFFWFFLGVKISRTCLLLEIWANVNIVFLTKSIDRRDK